MAILLSEKQWLSFADVTRMLKHLQRTQVARTRHGRRKLLLFACACCRTMLWDLPVKQEFRSIVEQMEQVADGKLDRSQLPTQAIRDLNSGLFATLPPANVWSASQAMTELILQTNAFRAAQFVARECAWSTTRVSGGSLTSLEAKRRQAELLHD